MTIDTRGTKGRTRADAGGTGQGEGPTTRRRILQIALSLMSQRGVDGTSMRDLASAAGLNVASLYHYFPSKRDLLEAVLVEQGYLPITAPPGEDGAPAPDLTLSEMLADYMRNMFEVEDFVRLMVGEAMRGEATARTVGLDLFSSFQNSIEDWITDNRPDLAA
ncbi:MAG TPA: TetR/AcrR family transcriptional regulator, partial [Acidimicrobiales bacterium]|nr:TetR/AcrR family transcriptional regulator [Acidimicrobiales bacterium]